MAHVVEEYNHAVAFIALDRSLAERGVNDLGADCEPSGAREIRSPDPVAGNRGGSYRPTR